MEKIVDVLLRLLGLEKYDEIVPKVTALKAENARLRDVEAKANEWCMAEGEGAGETIQQLNAVADAAVKLLGALQHQELYEGLTGREQQAMDHVRETLRTAGKLGNAP